MEQEKIIEGNKLIMDFEGNLTLDSKEWVNSDKKLAGELKYHSSWDWLMPVVDKINKTWDNSDLDGDDFLPGEQIIKVIRSALATASIKVVFEQVVKFIEWHNSQTK